MSWWDYVQRTSRAKTQQEIADRTGIRSATVSRWKTGQEPEPQSVVLYARAYGRPVLEAFVGAGLITPADAEQRPAAAPSLSSLSDDELLAEVKARMGAGRETQEPGSETSGEVHGGTGRPPPMTPLEVAAAARAAQVAAKRVKPGRTRRASSA